MSPRTLPLTTMVLALIAALLAFGAVVVRYLKTGEFDLGTAAGGLFMVALALTMLGRLRKAPLGPGGPPP